MFKKLVQGVANDSLPKTIKQKHVVTECREPYHYHVDRRIEMWGVEYKNHWVEITQQDGGFNVRIDENPTTAVYGLATREKAEEYVTRALG